jgi:hypothetical protein
VFLNFANEPDESQEGAIIGTALHGCYSFGHIRCSMPPRVNAKQSGCTLGQNFWKDQLISSERQ